MASHDVTVELFYSGDWHDHTATDEVYNGEATHGDDVKISHGKDAWSGGITPASATLVFRSWRFNPDYVSGDLYGLIGRNTPIRITVDGDVRFAGEVASWTPRQSLGGDVQVPDRWVEVIAGGVLRRLEAGTDPLPSALKTFYLDAAAQPVAYWTMEHGPLSDTTYPEIGPGSFIWTNAILESADVAPWLEPGVSIKTGTSLTGDVTMTTAPSRWAVDFMRAVDGDDIREFRFVVVGNTLDGSGWRHDFRMNFDATAGTVELIQDFDGTGAPASVTLTTTAVDVFAGTPNHVRLDLAQAGTAVDWELTIDGDVIDLGSLAATTLQGIAFIAPVSLPGTGSSTAFSHIAVFNGDPPALADTVDAAAGYQGEHAGDRFSRLSAESDVTDTVVGDAADTFAMGPQFPGELAAQYSEIQDTDDGIVFDTVTEVGVTYKTGRDRYSQAPTLELDYGAYEIAPPLHPVIDDKRIRNDVTVSRREGASARAVDGDNITALGRYKDTHDVNVFSDLVIDAPTGWRLHTGTVGGTGTRFEKLTIDLDACPHLQDAVVATSIGDRITIDHLPPELTPDLASLLVVGWSEVIASDRRKITFSCSSEAAMHIAELEHDDYATVGPQFTTLSGNHTATSPSLAIDCGADGLWAHEADFDIVVNGERMTVTGDAFGSGTFPNESQVLNVRRGVNVPAKVHAEGSPVRLFHPAYIGL